ncbi:hypothetical protein DFS34DRAFT_231820 [Phlyctochytrium arcticum]|nr:hypothetical protein DFS34DRAFT_231820 [Phlyctochytrium arcticum]
MPSATQQHQIQQRQKTHVARLTTIAVLLALLPITLAIPQIPICVPACPATYECLAGNTCLKVILQTPEPAPPTTTVRPTAIPPPPQPTAASRIPTEEPIPSPTPVPSSSVPPVPTSTLTRQQNQQPATSSISSSAGSLPTTDINGVVAPQRIDQTASRTLDPATIVAIILGALAGLIACVGTFVFRRRRHQEMRASGYYGPKSDGRASVLSVMSMGKGYGSGRRSWIRDRLSGMRVSTAIRPMSKARLSPTPERKVADLGVLHSTTTTVSSQPPRLAMPRFSTSIPSPPTPPVRSSSSHPESPLRSQFNAQHLPTSPHRSQRHQFLQHSARQESLSPSHHHHQQLRTPAHGRTSTLLHPPPQGGLPNLPPPVPVNSIYRIRDKTDRPLPLLPHTDPFHLSPDSTVWDSETLRKSIGIEDLTAVVENMSLPAIVMPQQLKRAPSTVVTTQLDIDTPSSSESKCKQLRTSLSASSLLRAISSMMKHGTPPPAANSQSKPVPVAPARISSRSPTSATNSSFPHTSKPSPPPPVKLAIRPSRNTSLAAPLSAKTSPIRVHISNAHAAPPSPTPAPRSVLLPPNWDADMYEQHITSRFPTATTSSAATTTLSRMPTGASGKSYLSSAGTGAARSEISESENFWDYRERKAVW